jgi:hypothetical protein
MKNSKTELNDGKQNLILEGSENENLEYNEEFENFDEIDEENMMNQNDEVFAEQFEKYCESGEWFRNNDDDDIEYPDSRNCNYKIW